jgi:cytochrome c biogenesis protein CcmG/thiol:disulfide interchange protein DsbE
MEVPELINSVRAVRRIPPVARVIVLVGLLAMVGAAGFALQREASVSSDAPHVGTPAPEFSLNTLVGQRTSLAAYRGHPVIVNFWATWCPPCRAEMPAISSVAKAHPDTIVLAVDVLEGPALVQIYLNDMPLGFAPLLDPDGRAASVYKVNSLPSSFFVGPDGTIRAINIGPMDLPTIEANLRKAV